MITAKDSEFHPVARDNWRWAETTPLSFSVPEAGILGNLYIAARPNLGVALSSVGIVQGFRFQPYEVDFSDAQMHLPCPDNFTDYELASGLSVKVVQAPHRVHFRYSYKLSDACSLDLQFRGLHEPFDAADPAQNPLLASAAGRRYDERLGTQWGNPSSSADPSGHFELFGHITGHLVLRGKRYEVDCFDCVDHSWSTRTETSKRAVSWISAVFGEDYGVHMAMLIDQRGGRTLYESLRNGYVMRDGRVLGLVAATVDARHAHHCPMTCRIVATDVEGGRHELLGTAVAVHPWYNYNPSHCAFQSLMRWQTPDGRLGHSEMADIYGLEYLAEVRANASGAGR